MNLTGEYNSSIFRVNLTILKIKKIRKNSKATLVTGREGP
jgi:hypothetical protein